MASVLASIFRDCIIKSAGIDWLTLTSTSPETKKEMEQCFRRVSVADHQLGYETNPGGAWGFYGLRARHALYATKEDRAMLVVSGKAAQQCVVLARPGDNATRLDVQVTIYVGEESVSDFLEMQFRQAETNGERRGQPVKPKATISPHRYETVYVGSRKSEVFVRCYDKFLESGDEAFRGCVRLEVEYKGDTSKRLWAHMAETGQGVWYLLQVLLSTLANKGLDVSMIDIEKQDIAKPARVRHRDEITIGWLATQVSSAVQRVSRSTGWWLPFCAVFERVCTEADKACILQSLALAWGN